MSKFDYKKELKESIGDGILKSSILIGTGYVMGNNKPSLSLNFKNFAIIAAVIAGGDVLYDYGKQQKWWPWL